jgi:predicted metalloprotease with PDZ domain
MAEGVTDYYAHILLGRYHILTPEAIGSTISSLTEAIQNSDGPYALSLEELSLEESNFNIENAMQFYSRGTLSGLLLDIELRTRSNNKTSLDDVLLALNKEAKQGKHYQHDKLADKIRKITGVDVKEFYKAYIAGTRPYPIDEYLSKLGIARNIRFTERNGVSLRTKFDTTDGVLIIDTIFESSPLYGATVTHGDTLLRIGVNEATPSSFNSWARSHETPHTETFIFGTQSGRIEKTINLIVPRESFTQTLEIGVLPETTPKQDAIRHAIFGKRFNFIGWKPNSTVRNFEPNIPRPDK